MKLAEEAKECCFQEEEPAKVTFAEFLENCKRSYKFLKESELSGSHAFAKSLGEVYGVECVKSGDINEAEFELCTSLGEFKICGGWGRELGLLDVEIEENVNVRYTDIRLVTAFGLFGLDLFDGKHKTYRFGDEGCGCLEAKVGFDKGQWIELRGMSENWAWNIAYRNGFPRCLDRFEHFCQKIAWLDEWGKLIEDTDEMMNCNTLLLQMNACCLRSDQLHDCGWTCSHVVPHRLMDSILSMKKIWE